MPQDTTSPTKTHPNPKEQTSVSRAISLDGQDNTLETNSKTKESQLWKNCVENIRSRVSDAVWEMTFSKIRAVELNRNLLILKVPTSLHKTRIEGSHFSVLKDAMEKTRPGTTVQIGIDHPKTPVYTQDRAESSTDDRRAVSSSGEHSSSDVAENGSKPKDTSTLGVDTTDEKSGGSKKGAGTKIATNDRADTNVATRDRADTNDHGLNPRLTFDQFVAGSSNRFAHAASLALAEQPSCDYNPLFIYGNSGMGKTHLLQAIAHYSAKNHPCQKFKYVTSETFLNEFVRAIRNNLQPDFKQRYRHNKTLLVDDVQFLQDKDGLQEEFFHTFNDVMQNGGRIVLSSDRPPDAIPTLENRLRSRFRSGLITDIQPPDLVTRMAILQKKLEAKSIHLDNDVTTFIAESITNSIRELEGALIKIVAYTKLTGRHCDLKLAQELLSDIIESSNKELITIDTIINTTAQTLGFTREQLVGSSRRRSLVEARQIAMYITRNLTDLSYPEVGKGFGNRDHTTVMHAFKKIQARISEDHDMFNRVQQVQHHINQGR